MNREGKNNFTPNTYNFYQMPNMFNHIPFQMDMDKFPDMNIYQTGMFEPMQFNFNPEDYIFVKFGKRGWECQKCNNFNFESKNLFYLL